MEEHIDAYLSVTSLGLLGFNIEHYNSHCSPINCASFERENETLFLCTTHFLLSKLDAEYFTRATVKCWPVLNAKCKRDFKNIVYQSLQRLRTAKIPEIQMQLSDEFWESDLCLKGAEVWKLLRLLTDACLDAEINILKPRETTGGCSVESLHTIQSTDSQATTHADDDDKSPPSLTTNAPPRRKSFIQQQSEALHGLNRIDSFIVRSSAAEDGTSTSRNDLLHFITEEQRKVEELVTLRIAKHNRINAYALELDDRLKTAKASLELLQQRIRKSMQKDTVFALTEAGRKLRVTKLERLNASLSLIEDLVQSPVLSAAELRLSLRSSSSASASASAVTADHQQKQGLSLASGNRISSCNSNSSSGGGALLNQREQLEFETRVEAGKNELLQQASLVYAIDALASCIQEVNLMFQPRK